jgi:hypothetical protein
MDMMDLLPLGDQTYELLGRTGESMTGPEIVTDGYDQIDPARGDLNAVSSIPTSQPRAGLGQGWVRLWRRTPAVSSFAS